MESRNSKEISFRNCSVNYNDFFLNYYLINNLRGYFDTQLLTLLIRIAINFVFEIPWKQQQKEYFEKSTPLKFLRPRKILFYSSRLDFGKVPLIHQSTLFVRELNLSCEIKGLEQK